jgi:ubiquinone/menaquinone biosynthesis C-methylase UbiE
VRDPWGLNERLFALYYPVLCGISERAGQREVRRDLLAEASGRVLEVGAGSGLNLPHYTAEVTELVATDPSPHMLEELRDAAAKAAPPVGDLRVERADAESLPFGDESFDTVVSTYVLCTVPDPERALAEIARVLRPGGRFLYLEHVRAKEGTWRGRLQDAMELPQRYLAAGCHPNRRTGELIERSPLRVERLERSEMPRAFPTVKPVVLGSAVRPAAGT